jgi:hypothetical protein
MGKAAENERIKLKATYFNNLAVGLALAGVFVPYLAFAQTWQPIHGFPAILYDWVGDEQVHTKILAVLIALSFSRWFRYKANKEIQKIQD